MQTLFRLCSACGAPLGELEAERENTQTGPACSVLLCMKDERQDGFAKLILKSLSPTAHEDGRNGVSLAPLLHMTACVQSFIFASLASAKQQTDVNNGRGDNKKMAQPNHARQKRKKGTKNRSHKRKSHSSAIRVLLWIKRSHDATVSWLCRGSSQQLKPRYTV